MKEEFEKELKGNEMNIHKNNATDKKNQELDEMRTDLKDNPERLESYLSRQSHFSKPQIDFTNGVLMTNGNDRYFAHDEVQYNLFILKGYQTITKEQHEALHYEGKKNVW